MYTTHVKKIQFVREMYMFIDNSISYGEDVYIVGSNL